MDIINKLKYYQIPMLMAILASGFFLSWLVFVGLGGDRYGAPGWGWPQTGAIVTALLTYVVAHLYRRWAQKPAKNKAE